MSLPGFDISVSSVLSQTALPDACVCYRRITVAHLRNYLLVKWIHHALLRSTVTHKKTSLPSLKKQKRYLLHVACAADVI